MFGIPKVYLILAAVLVAIAIYFTGHHKGWVERDMEMQVEIAKRNEESREIERNMTSKLNANATKLEEANHAITEKSTALDRAIRAGRVRLPSSSCVPAPTNTTVASADTTDASESDRQTLILIAQIAADGDKAINQLNACIDAYNEVRSQINGNR
jgi:flagellar capping protein FliD